MQANSRNQARDPAGAAEDRFVTVYRAVYADLLRFVQRRWASDAEDVVAEAMTIAWRRRDDLPQTLGGARAWVFGIARNCMLNHSRSVQRGDALQVRLRSVDQQLPGPAAVDAALTRVDVARAWGLLDPGEQEVIALQVLEGLDSASAGQVLGISAVAYRTRLSRARGALRRHLEGAAEPVGVRTEGK